MEEPVSEATPAAEPIKPKSKKSAPKKAVNPAVKTALKAAKVAKTEKPAKAIAAKSSSTNSELQTAANAFKIASDLTRIKIMLFIADDSKNVTEICKYLKQSQPAVSHHLALLRVGGYIEPTRSGKNNFYALTRIGRLLVKSTSDLIEQFKARS